MNTLCVHLLLIFALAGCSFGVTYIDLSYPINNDTVFHPRHRRYEKLIDFEGYTPEGIWFATHSMSTSEHTATHLDTPFHTNEHGWSLDQIPTDNLINMPAVMIDMSDKVTVAGTTNYQYSVNKIDLVEWEKTHGIIPQRAVVLINTGWGQRWPKADYLGEDGSGSMNFPGLELCGARFLSTERNAVGVGIDTASIDAGFMHELMAHNQLSSKNVYILENVANLHLLPPKNFNVWVMPLKLEKETTGAPVRLIAVVP